MGYSFTRRGAGPHRDISSVAKPELPGAATYRAAPEPEPIFGLVLFRQAKQESLVLMSNMT